MTDNALILPTPDTLLIAGQVANDFAAANVFEDYRQRIAANTLRRQEADLALFTSFLKEAGVIPGPLNQAAEAWRGMTWGLIAAFARWQIASGYAIGSVNVRLATVKRYAELAHQAGAIDADAYLLIQTVRGYGHKQARQVDEKRDVTRRGPKKAQATRLTREQIAALKAQPDTPQGRRDALLMTLLLDHGLRCGEITGLEVEAFDLQAGTFTFHRPKVDKVQTHKLTGDAWRAAGAYLTQDGPSIGGLLLGSHKGGRLGGAMSARAIHKRVRQLGQRIGVERLAPHDCRHAWATCAAQGGTDPFRLQEAGGWNSLTMPRRYIDEQKIANEGVVLAH